jgi:hypothetical protein
MAFLPPNFYDVKAFRKVFSFNPNFFYLHDIKHQENKMKLCLIFNFIYLPNYLLNDPSILNIFTLVLMAYVKINN